MWLMECTRMAHYPCGQIYTAVEIWLERKKYILARVLECLAIQIMDTTALGFNSTEHIITEQIITEGGNISDVGYSTSVTGKRTFIPPQLIMNHCRIRHRHISIPSLWKSFMPSPPTQARQSPYLQIRRSTWSAVASLLPINTHGNISKLTFRIPRTGVGYHVLPYGDITSTPSNTSAVKWVTLNRELRSLRTGKISLGVRLNVRNGQPPQQHKKRLWRY